MKIVRSLITTTAKIKPINDKAIVDFFEFAECNYPPESGVIIEMDEMNGWDIVRFFETLEYTQVDEIRGNLPDYPQADDNAVEILIEDFVGSQDKDVFLDWKVEMEVDNDE
mgnify:CR=1 FL=1